MSRAVTTLLNESRPRAVAGWPAWWPLAPFVVAMLYLTCVMPYAAGYANFRLTIAQWLRIQWAQPAWQHGALAPLIAGFLVWRKRAELSTIKVAPGWAGLVLTVFALFVFWTGYRGNFYFLGFASLHLLAGSGVLWLWGWETFRRNCFAWFILGFAWPYLFLEDTLAFQLRYLMVGITSGLLNFFGIATLQDGTSLISAATEQRAQGTWFSLAVDGPCSGMRSLFALMMVSALYGYFRQRSFWRRLLMFALSLPLAVLANMARLFVLIAASMLFGQDFAVGHGEDYASNFHLLVGVVVFLVALPGLRFAETLLNRFCGREKPLPLIPG